MKVKGMLPFKAVRRTDNPCCTEVVQFAHHRTHMHTLFGRQPAALPAFFLLLVRKYERLKARQNAGASETDKRAGEADSE